MSLNQLKWIIVPILVFPLVSCTNNALENIRKVTYPPDFNYISKSKISSTMHQLALYTTLLDNSFRDTSLINEEQISNAIGILRKMESLSSDLGSESLSSNHNLISNNIDQFRERVIDARVGLQQNPPNYYRVGAISAYCLNCHSIAN